MAGKIAEPDACGMPARNICAPGVRRGYLPPMPYPHLIIDGYSLLHRDARARALLGRNLAFARRGLLERLERHGAALADAITIVFDGKGGMAGPAFESHLIEVVFSDGARTADTVIEQFVHAHPRPESLWVVTSDRPERETVEAAGANSMSCGEFLERLQACSVATARRINAPPARLRPTLGDLMPPAPRRGP